MVIKMQLGLIAAHFVDSLWQSNMMDDTDIDPKSSKIHGTSINTGFSLATRHLWILQCQV